MNKTIRSTLWIVTSLGVSVGCGSSTDTPIASGGGKDGGATQTTGGQGNGSGGLTGNPDGGASSAQGGKASTTGGTVSSLGGSTAAGGAATGGSNPGSGGMPVGGRATGGTQAGGTSAGGSRSGGAPAAGGNTSGGSAAGGTPAVGGTAAGGTATGGRATGGAPGGGSASGGNASGGSAAGGTPSGGTASGGTASGGSATGGIASGGTASGGVATGGSATGGTASGGSATGGSGTLTAINVWLAGDSTMQNCSSACPCGWGMAFDPYFNTLVTVNNNAVGGRSIQTWMYEPNVTTTLGSNGECGVTETNSTRWANTISGMKAGDYLFIQFGINDGSATCDRHVGLARFQELLGRMAAQAKTKGAQPIFVTPVSAISCSGSVAQPTRGSYVTATITAGTTYDVPVIDLHQLSIDLYNDLGLCPNNADYTTGTVGAFFCADHTHFEAAGAKQIAGLVASALRTQGIGLAGYLL